MTNVALQSSAPILLTFRSLHEDARSEYLARGSAADIWKTAQEMPDTHISLRVSKMLRVSPSDFDGAFGARGSDRNNQPSYNCFSWAYFVKKYRDKVREWARLTHPNIVQVYDIDFQHDLNLCVEFCSNGSVRDYLKTHTEGQINKADIISDVLAALKYLHSRDPSVVHGSLNAGKLFIDGHGRTKVGEFGLTALCSYVAPLVPSVIFAGLSRWMSPELFGLFDLDGSPLPTVASDIWALACTIVEIISEKLPYTEFKHEGRVQRAILEGRPPSCRDTNFNDQFGSDLWSIIEPCWSKDPCQRPSIHDIMGRVEAAQRRMIESSSQKIEKTPEQSLESSGDRAHSGSTVLAPPIPMSTSPQTLKGARRQGSTISGTRPARPRALSALPRHQTQESHDAALDEIRAFLNGRSAYNVFPVSFRLIVLDTKLEVKKALDTLILNGAVSAPLWNSDTSRFAGMFTVADIIHLIQYYYHTSSYDNAAADVEHFRLESLRKIEQELKVPPPPLLSVHPLKPLYEACRLLIQTHARRLPLLDHDEQTGDQVVLSVLTQYRVLKFIAINCRDIIHLHMSLRSLGIGTYVKPQSDNPFHPIATATLSTRVFDVVHMFSERGISAVPIIDENGIVVNLYETVDVITLVRLGEYKSLDLTIAAALAHRAPDFPGVITCTPSDSLASLLALVRQRRVHRLVVVEGEDGRKGRLAGIITLSDVLKYVVGEDVDSASPQSAPAQQLSAESQRGSPT